uniref:Uncharacterized protein n=1 Tax=Cryptomonas curvata TaxID=233186 RepID=A0A7S0QNV1_9CRYP
MYNCMAEHRNEQDPNPSEESFSSCPTNRLFIPEEFLAVNHSGNLSSRDFFPLDLENLRKQLNIFYGRYNPSKLQDIYQLAQSFVNRQSELNKLLRSTYDADLFSIGADTIILTQPRQSCRLVKQEVIFPFNQDDFSRGFNKNGYVAGIHFPSATHGGCPVCKKQKMCHRAIKQWLAIVHRRAFSQTSVRHILQVNSNRLLIKVLLFWRVITRKRQRLRVLCDRWTLINKTRLKMRAYYEFKRLLSAMCMIRKQKHQICHLIHEFKNVRDNATRKAASKEKEHQAEISSYAEKLERLTHENQIQRMEISRMQEEITGSILKSEINLQIEDLDCANTKVAEIHNETAIDIRVEIELQKGISLTQEQLSSALNKAAALEIEVVRLSLEVDRLRGIINSNPSKPLVFYESKVIQVQDKISDNDFLLLATSPSSLIVGEMLRVPVMESTLTADSQEGTMNGPEVEQLRHDIESKQRAIGALLLKDQEGQGEVARLSAELRRLQGLMKKMVPQVQHESMVRSLCAQLTRLQAHADRMVIGQAEQDSELAIAAARAERLRADRDDLAAELESLRSIRATFAPLAAGSAAAAASGPRAAPAAEPSEIGCGPAYEQDNCSSVLCDLSSLRCVIDDLNQRCRIATGGRPGAGLEDPARPSLNLSPSESSSSKFECLSPSHVGGPPAPPGPPGSPMGVAQPCEAQPTLWPGRSDGSVSAAAAAALVLSPQGAATGDAWEEVAALRGEVEARQATVDRLLAKERDLEAEVAGLSTELELARGAMAGVVPRAQAEAQQRSLAAQLGQARAQVDKMAVREAGQCARLAGLSQRMDEALAATRAAEAELARARERLGCVEARARGDAGRINAELGAAAADVARLLHDACDAAAAAGDGGERKLGGAAGGTACVVCGLRSGAGYRPTVVPHQAV